MGMVRIQATGPGDAAALFSSILKEPSGGSSTGLLLPSQLSAFPMEVFLEGAAHRLIFKIIEKSLRILSI